MKFEWFSRGRFPSSTTGVSGVKCPFLSAECMQPLPTSPRRSRSMARYSVAALVALGAAACGNAVDEHGARSTQSIAGGTTDTTHDNVFELVMNSKCPERCARPR